MAEGMSPLTMQILGLMMGTGILGVLIRIAILAGRYMQRLDTAENNIVILRTEVGEVRKTQGEIYKEVLLIQGHLRGATLSAKGPTP